MWKEQIPNRSDELLNELNRQLLQLFYENHYKSPLGQGLDENLVVLGGYGYINSQAWLIVSPPCAAYIYN